MIDYVEHHFYGPLIGNLLYKIATKICANKWRGWWQIGFTVRQQNLRSPFTFFVFLCRFHRILNFKNYSYVLIELYIFVKALLFRSFEEIANEIVSVSNKFFTVHPKVNFATNNYFLSPVN